MQQTDPHESDIRQASLREIEQVFHRGVRANIEAGAAELAEELTGKPGKLYSITEDSDRQLVMDAWLLGGRQTGQKMPINRELWATVRRGRRPVLTVGVKSFAGWEAVARHRPCDVAEEARKFLANQSYRYRDMANIIVLFAPGGWPKRAAAAWPHGANVLLCEGRESGGIRLLGDYAWHTWLALTPMSLGERKAACLRALGEQRELQLPGGVMRASRVIQRLGLPEPVGRRLLELALADRDAPYRMRKAPDGGEYVRRNETAAGAAALSGMRWT